MIRNKIEDIERFDEILRIIVQQESGYLVERAGLEDRLPFLQRMKVKEHERPGPERLRETFEELGTTFIKLGQMIANRPDIAPQEYVEELEKLEYAVTPVDWKEIEKVVEEEIGLDRFSYVNEEPMATASIAQVHEARLETGEKVVIKVRKPGVKEEVLKDLEILQYVADKADIHISQARRLKFKDVIEQFCDWTRDELDFEKEAKNAEIFEETLPDDENARTPKIYTEHSTGAVLTMEKIEGFKCTDKEAVEEHGIDVKDLTDTLLAVGLKQSVVSGYFHGDPHPSNFLIEEDGTVVYIDFGITGTIPKKQRDLMALMVIHIINEDVEAAVDVVKELAYLDDDADFDKLEKIITEKTVELKNTSVSDISISMEIMDIAVEASKIGIHMPNNVVLIGKNLVTTEGIAMKIAPDRKIDEGVKKQALQALKRANKPEDMAESLAVDMIQNKDLITKLPSKINKQMSQDREIEVENKVETPQTDLTEPAVIMSTAALGIAGLYVTGENLPMIVAFALIAGYYITS